MKTVYCLLIALLVLPAARAQTPIPEPDPWEVLRQVSANGNLNTNNHGEGYTWHAASGAGIFLDAYEAFRNPEWLAAAESYYKRFLLDTLSQDPDGYEGWIGAILGNPEAALRTDEVVGDANMLKPLVRFACLVKDNPELQERFGATAREYTRLATRIGWEKWNRRGCYYQDAHGWGSYHTYTRLIDPATGQWIEAPTRHISDNLNKHYAMGSVMLRLWRLTGNPEYKQRVLAIFARAKSMWRYLPDEDRVVWNFWMPHGPYDIEGRAPSSWVGVHPGRAGYQSGEVSLFVEVYDSGLVFSREDMERMIRTNHWMMPTAGREDWRSADGTSTAGTLWPALARFDERIRQAAWAGVQGKTDAHSRIRQAYLKNVVEPKVGWERRYVRDPSQVQVVDVPLQPGRHLTMSVVIPNRLEVAANERIQFVTQTRRAGSLVIDLLQPDGTPLGNLFTIEVGGESVYSAPAWDGTNPATGRKDLGTYRVRWTLGDESRTQPVYVVQGEARAQAGPPQLAPGQTVTIDFEEPLHPESWLLDRAAVTKEKAFRGESSLKIDGQARFVFGRHDDLPVRIRFRAWDEGHLQEGNGDGPAWGVQTALGDRFAMRMVWRAYMAGNRIYSWLNTGHNQWFNPNNSGIARQPGWNEWVFDFTDPEKVRVTCNGREARLTPQWTPKGAVALFLMGSRVGGPFYIDDVTVEYPAP